ncbi:MAG: glycosyltransferase family A protein [Infirmifilum sp.]
MSRCNARVFVVIPTLRDPPIYALRSLFKQTLKPQKIIIVAGSRKLEEIVSRWAGEFKGLVEVTYYRPDMMEHVGVRVGKALNYVFERENLQQYDYLLKLDADAVLREKCLEDCVNREADLIGLGYFMLIRMKSFLKVLGGRWPVTPGDDAYIAHAFRSLGLKVEPMPPDIIVLRKSGVGGNWRYYFYRGVDDYRAGINPIMMLKIVFRLSYKRRTLLPLFTLVGYVRALTGRVKRFEFAPLVFKSTLKIPSQRAKN